MENPHPAQESLSDAVGAFLGSIRFTTNPWGAAAWMRDLLRLRQWRKLAGSGGGRAANIRCDTPWLAVLIADALRAGYFAYGERR